MQNYFQDTKFPESTLCYDSNNRRRHHHHHFLIGLLFILLFLLLFWCDHVCGVIVENSSSCCSHPTQIKTSNIGTTSLHVCSLCKEVDTIKDNNAKHHHHISCGTAQILFSGSKNGKLLYQSPVTSKEYRNQASSTNKELFTELENQRYPSNFPIFSMESCCIKNEVFVLFCGGGDRYITLWQEESSLTSPSKIVVPMQQRLGPHTGWVKALQYDTQQQVLYSLGCNCIETWKLVYNNNNTKNNKQPPISFVHASKRTVENCPNLGATLSSDLLCLCILNNNKHTTDGSNSNNFLLSGGVDGRIHQWSFDYMIQAPLTSIPVHNGRVNKIFTTNNDYGQNDNDIAYSIGHDGYIKAILCCTTTYNDNNFDNIETLCKDIGGLCLPNSPRISAGTCLQKSKDNNIDNNVQQIVVGTTTGQVFFLSAIVKDSKKCVEFVINNQIIIHGNPVIHDIQSFIESSDMEPSILVGHSIGVTLVTM